MGVCMKDAWRELIGFHQWGNGDGDNSHEELIAGVDKTFATMDKDGDGHIDGHELREFLDHKNVAHKGLLAQMIKTLDVDGDGKISRSELAALAV